MLAQHRILILGLEGTMAAELAALLSALDQRVAWQNCAGEGELPAIMKRARPDLVFCGSDPGGLRALLAAARRVKPGLPVVVASREAQVPAWLDALEAGAADYCAAPFETAQVRWVLESHLRHRRSAA